MDKQSQSIYDKLEQTLNYHFYPETSNACYLSEPKCQAWINLQDNPQYKAFAELVIAHTRYVPFLTTMNEFHKIFEVFGLIDKPFWIFFNTEDFGSENWIIVLLWSLLRKKQVAGFITNTRELPSNVTDILIVDDAIYSGGSIAGTVDELLSYRSTNQLPIQFHIMVPYMTNPGKDTIQGVVTTHNQTNLNSPLFPTSTPTPTPTPNFYQSIPLYNMEEIVTRYRPDLLPYLEEILLFYDNEVPGVPFYLDHKIAGEFSSLPRIYIDGKVHNQSIELCYKLPSRSVVQLVEDFFRDRTTLSY